MTFIENNPWIWGGQFVTSDGALFIRDFGEQ